MAKKRFYIKGKLYNLGAKKIINGKRYTYQTIESTRKLAEKQAKGWIRLGKPKGNNLAKIYKGYSVYNGKKETKYFIFIAYKKRPETYVKWRKARAKELIRYRKKRKK